MHLLIQIDLGLFSRVLSTCPDCIGTDIGKWVDRSCISRNAGFKRWNSIERNKENGFEVQVVRTGVWQHFFDRRILDVIERAIRSRNAASVSYMRKPVDLRTQGLWGTKMMQLSRWLKLSGFTLFQVGPRSIRSSPCTSGPIFLSDAIVMFSLIYYAISRAIAQRCNSAYRRARFKLCWPLAAWFRASC